MILDPLPCWQHLPKELIRQRVAEIVESAESDATRARADLDKVALEAWACGSPEEQLMPSVASPKQIAASLTERWSPRVIAELDDS